jgi:hypothetical protein
MVGLLLVFINKGLLKQSHIHLFTNCLWLLLQYKLSSWVEALQSLKYSLLGLCWKEFMDAWCIF